MRPVDGQLDLPAERRRHPYGDDIGDGRRVRGTPSSATSRLPGRWPSILADSLSSWPVQFISYEVLDDHWHLVLTCESALADLSAFMHWFEGKHAEHLRRAHRASKGFAFSAAITLALGIAATTTIFSVVYGVLLRPLPYRDADRLVIIQGEKDFSTGPRMMNYWRPSSRSSPGRRGHFRRSRMTAATGFTTAQRQRRSKLISGADRVGQHSSTTMGRRSSVGRCSATRPTRHDRDQRSSVAYALRAAAGRARQDADASRTSSIRVRGLHRSSA